MGKNIEESSRFTVFNIISRVGFTRKGNWTKIETMQMFVKRKGSRQWKALRLEVWLGRARNWWELKGVGKNVWRIRDKSLVSHLVDTGFYSEWNVRKDVVSSTISRNTFLVWLRIDRKQGQRQKSLRRILGQENMVACTRISAMQVVISSHILGIFGM